MRTPKCVELIIPGGFEGEINSKTNNKRYKKMKLITEGDKVRYKRSYEVSEKVFCSHM